MPKESKKQRLERESAEEAIQISKTQAEYPFRLVAALERASRRNFTIRFIEIGGPLDCKHVVQVNLPDMYDNDNGAAFCNVPTFCPDNGYDGDLCQLENELNFLDAEDERREQDKRLREAAIQKLTPDECRVLGLSKAK